MSEKTTRMCPMKALLSSGEDRCEGDDCMWFLKATNMSTGAFVDGCAIAFGSFEFGGYNITINSPEANT